MKVEKAHQKILDETETETEAPARIFSLHVFVAGLLVSDLSSGLPLLPFLLQIRRSSFTLSPGLSLRSHALPSRVAVRVSGLEAARFGRGQGGRPLGRVGVLGTSYVFSSLSSCQRTLGVGARVTHSLAGAAKTPTRLLSLSAKPVFDEVPRNTVVLN